MRCRLCILLFSLIAVSNCSTAHADGLFRRGARPEPSEHVPTLIKTLKSDLDERRRSDAAAELRDYDPKTFTDIIPALIEALKNDASISVRMEAANSIGKMRPISQIGGYALEQAESNDPAIRVRVIANGHLKLWVLFLGYKKGRMPDPLANQTEEPPLVEPPSGPPSLNPTKMPPSTPSNPGTRKEPFRPVPPLMSASGAPAPRNERFIPQLMKRLKPDVRSKSTEEGPSLNMPR